MKRIVRTIVFFLGDHFNLNEDRADEEHIVESIRSDVHFKGTNLWTLIFAIFIASIGLNVNATAVIIGAMLISPLMGPIMGVGLGIGILDFDLIKRGLKNLAVAAFISIGTSALYFLITPLHDASSELLARTNPSLWDVLIAFFGGLAGIVAGTRRKKSNVIPGVAIATALMPPLCTAGYGLATGNWMFLLGAIYLFFINSLFICLATYLIVKHLRFHKKVFASSDIEKRVSRSIFILVLLTVIPSIYLAYRIVERSIFEGNAKKFVQHEFRFNRTQVVDRNFQMNGSRKTIELLLVGQELPRPLLDSIRGRLHLYGLDSTKLVIHQGLNAQKEIDLVQIRASILKDVVNDLKPDTLVTPPSKLDLPIPDLRRELASLYPELASYSLSQVVLYSMDSTRKDTVSLFTGTATKVIPQPSREKLSSWLKERLNSDSVKLVIEQ